jgi:hypothetical protein
MRALLSMTAIAAAAAAAAADPAAPPACVVSAGARSFDLAELGGGGGAGGVPPLRHVSLAPASHGWTYSFAACGAIAPLPAACAGAAPGSAALQQTAGVCYGLGASATRSVTATATGVALSFSGGDGGRSSVITVECADVPRRQVVRWGDGSAPGSYTALVRARAGCALECARDPVTGAVCGGAQRGTCVIAAIHGHTASCACMDGYAGPQCLREPSKSQPTLLFPTTFSIHVIITASVFGFFSACIARTESRPGGVCSAKYVQLSSFIFVLLLCFYAMATAQETPALVDFSFGALTATSSSPLEEAHFHTVSHVASFAGGFADGCANVYVDFGSNVGIQVRKLFEPELFPGAPVLPFFDKHLGDVELRRRETCAIGFEINPALTPRLIELQTAYAAQGWRTLFLTETGVGFNDTTMTFRSDDDAAHLWWGSRLENGQGGKGSVQIPVMSIDRVMRSILQRRLPKTLVQKGPRVVVKLDVEGHELELMQLLAHEGVLCDISFLYAEIHDTASATALPAFINSLDDCRIVITALDDETSFDSNFTLPI